MAMDLELSEQDFERAADETLHELERALGDIEGLDVDLQSGILTIEFDDGTRYVINSHRAARQIWMAAERSAWHFDLVVADKRWIASRSGEEMMSALRRVLGAKLGRPVPLRS